jgi:PDZ domain-containing protein
VLLGGDWLRRRFWRVAAGVLVVLILVFVPTGYFIVRPGSAMDTSEFVTATGGAKDARGDLRFLTVSTDQANLFWYLFAQVDPKSDLEPKSQVLRPGEDLEEYLKKTRRMMHNSQAIAKVVALKTLGYPAKLITTGVRVDGFFEGSPAAGTLQEGDIITSVAGVPVGTRDELVERLGAFRPGEKAALVVRRNSVESSLEVTTTEHPEIKGRAAFLIEVSDAPLSSEIPVDIEIDPGNITGPSAGLMFTLEIIDQLDREIDWTRGWRIAGTGTILPDGSVGGIGGVVQKVFTAEAAGAEIMFVPQANAKDAQRVARKVRVVPVSHLNDALEFLRTNPKSH